MKSSPWPWRLLWLFCAIGWAVALAYIVADVREVVIDVF